MTEYRTQISPGIINNMQKSYNKLYKTYVQYGIFTDTARQKLLEFPEIDQSTYGPQFWSKIRKSVHKGLIDLSLFCSIANSDQLEKTLWAHDILPIPGTIESNTRILLPYVLSVIFHQNREDKVELWKVDMANRMLLDIFNFYRKTGMVPSKTYERMLDEVQDFINIEFIRISREKRNKE